jgi:3-deoxy-D-manno-octulosonate 8-phosphate phosphatase (KDO 8-P phosphatase)
MISYKEKLNQIKAFAFDVDGVLTNGEVLLIGGEVIRTLNSKDGYAIQYAAKMGYPIFIITGGNSHEVKTRLLGLGATEVHLAAFNKLNVFNSIIEKYGIGANEILYMGDDIPDYEVLQAAGVSSCPQDAAPEIKAICHYQSPYKGGQQCVRDVIEQTLRVQGKWFSDKAFEW